MEHGYIAFEGRGTWSKRFLFMEQNPLFKIDLDSICKNRFPLGEVDQVKSVIKQKLLEHSGGHKYILDYAHSFEASTTGGSVPAGFDRVWKINKLLVGSLDKSRTSLSSLRIQWTQRFTGSYTLICE